MPCFQDVIFCTLRVLSALRSGGNKQNTAVSPGGQILVLLNLMDITKLCWRDAAVGLKALRWSIKILSVVVAQ